MKPLPLFAWALSIGLALAFPQSSPANGGGYVTGVASTGAFKPLNIQKVEMLSEKLDIDLHIEHAEIRIEYVLHNPGPKVTIEAGFPSATAFDRISDEDETPVATPAKLAEVAALRNFQLQADGKPLKVSTRMDDLKLPQEGEEQVSEMSSGVTIQAWHVFKLDFAAGQTRRLMVQYRNPYHGSYDYVSDDERRSPLTLTYLFSSAAAWQGPIKQGVVTVRTITANPEYVKFSHPKRFQREGNTWKWSFTDFEPSLEDDLVITTRPNCFAKLSFEANSNGEIEGWNRTSYFGWGAKPDFSEKPKIGGKWELHRVDYSATASSTLAPAGEIRYDAELLAVNGDGSSAWVEGVRGPGIGESVTLTLPKPAKVSRIGIVNGYARNEELYYRNNRVSRLEVSVNGGKAFMVSLPDECLIREMFFFNLPESSVPLKTVKLSIAEVYKGNRDDDTCLSAVVLAVPLTKGPPLRMAR